jgi:adenylylsulfate kinase
MFMERTGTGYISVLKSTGGALSLSTEQEPCENGRMKGATIWLTGIPGAGKSTISQEVCRRLSQMGYPRCELLDGDVIRTHISQGLGFTREDRDTNILRIGWVAQLLTKHGIIAVVAAISPYEAMRSRVREMVTEAGGPRSFIEVYVKCSIEECMRRDPKGLYRRAQEGKISGLTGFDAPYEEPKAPELVIETQSVTAEVAAKKIVDYLASVGALQPNKM